MTIKVYAYNAQEEKELLDFLKSRHYSYKSADESELLPDAEFLSQYNKELDDAETQIDAGNYLANDEVKKRLADRRKRISGN